MKIIPNPGELIKIIGIETPLIGFYDVPDPKAFEPIVKPNKTGRACIFAFYKKWLEGNTLLLTKDNFGCPGANSHLFNQNFRSRDDFVAFLADDEGLKANHALMNDWLDNNKSYEPEYGNIFIGPLKNNQYEYLKTVTFLVNPDQLSILTIGAQYFSSSKDPDPVIAPFGSGCMMLVSLFNDLSVSQAIIGSTDIAMRKYIPPEMMAFTVTKPLYEKLCNLDKNSFLYKSFWASLKKVRSKNKAL